jgi:hypothetical protein
MSKTTNGKDSTKSSQSRDNIKSVNSSSSGKTKPNPNKQPKPPKK